jgi:hypothetical protein
MYSTKLLVVNDDDAEADADRDVSSIVTDYTELWRNRGIHEVLCEASCILVDTVYANRNVRGDEVAREGGVLTNHTRRFAQLTKKIWLYTDGERSASFFAMHRVQQPMRCVPASMCVTSSEHSIVSGCNCYRVYTYLRAQRGVQA